MSAKSIDTITCDDTIALAARSSAPRSGDRHGTGLVLSPDGGKTWDYLGNVDDTAGENGYPDLVRLADGRILCVYYTGHTNIRGVFLEER